MLYLLVKGTRNADNECCSFGFKNLRDFANRPMHAKYLIKMACVKYKMVWVGGLLKSVCSTLDSKTCNKTKGDWWRDVLR